MFSLKKIQEIFFLQVILVVVFFIFSGCSQDDLPETPKLFIPKEPGQAQAFFLNEKKEGNTTSLFRNSEEYFLLEEQKEQNSEQVFRIYSTHKDGCGIGKGFCIFEVWQGDEKIFFYEESEEGKLQNFLGGMPITFEEKNKILVLLEDEQKNSFRKFVSIFDVSSQNSSFLLKEVFWKNTDSYEKNQVITLTKNGISYLFDPFSYADSFRAYKILDENKPFYVKGTGLENLEFLANIDLPKDAQVILEERYDGIFFRITTEEESFLYEFFVSGEFKEQKDKKQFIDPLL